MGPTQEAQASQDYEVPSWFKETFESIGANFVAKGNEVAAETPWGAGYQPKRMADMNSTQREEAQGMLKRYNDDPDYGETDAPNGTKVITHLPSGFAVNSDNFMLTANAEGKHEVASMFDIGMMTGELTKGKAEMDAQRAVLNYKPQTEDPMAPATSVPPTAEETAMGKEMLAVDESGATPPTDGQAPGAPLAVAGAAVPTGGMPIRTMAPGEDDPTQVGNTFSPDGGKTNLNVEEYDVDTYNRHVKSRIDKELGDALVSEGFKRGTPAFEKAMSDPKNIADYSTAVAQMYKKTPAKVEPQPVAPTSVKPEDQLVNAEPKVESGPPSHWDDTKTDSGLERAYDNGEYGNNYGNYDSREQYYARLKETYKNFQTIGKMSVSDDKALTNFRNNAKRYYDLGIATPGDLERYKADMKNADSKRNALSSAAGRKEEREMKRQKFIDEAATEIDRRVDAGEPILGVTDHLTTSQARKLNSKKGDRTGKQEQRYTDMMETADNVRRIQTHLKKADMESLETLSPVERGKAFIAKYNGDMSQGQLEAMFAKQGMKELISKTVKQISGAAASDQERAFIESWMLGEPGVSGEVVQAIMDKVQRKTYDQASRYGQELYNDSEFGRLHNLSTSVRDLRDIQPNEKLIAEGLKKYGERKNKNSNTRRVPGERRN